MWSSRPALEDRAMIVRGAKSAGRPLGQPFEPGLTSLVRARPRRRHQHDDTCLLLASILHELQDLTARDRDILRAMIRVGPNAIALAEDLAPGREMSYRSHVTRRKRVYAQIVERLLRRLQGRSASRIPGPLDTKDL
jgi:FixJ family two-component response regulator